MKKNINVVLVLVLFLSLFLFHTSGVVNASPDPATPKAGLANGAWSAGTEVDINLDAAKYPGLQLLTKGVKISQPTRLCHEFRGGDYGWVAEIRKLKNGAWVKQPTTMGWQPDAEGAFMACTEASAAGTYALFGWFDPKSPKVRQTGLPLCDNKLLLDSYYTTSDNGTYFITTFSFSIPSMPNTPMTLNIVKALDKTDSALTYDTSNFKATDYSDKSGDLYLGDIESENEPGYYHVTLTTPTCYFNLDPLDFVR